MPSLRARLGAFMLSCAFLTGAASAARPAFAEEPATADACVGFQNDYGDKEITVHASNGCERRLACTLAYQVRCEANDGKVVSVTAKQAAFTLTANGKADLTLSATSCKQAWAIDNLAWACR
ncbi:MAG TPA: hypothetical protein VHP33_05090 [Polyangiaceae bacterium]|nr:hypothetical protein [Polyangiaceae bacterium]